MHRRKVNKNDFIRENAKNMFHIVSRVRKRILGRNFQKHHSYTLFSIFHLAECSAACGLISIIHYFHFTFSNLLHVLIILVIIFLENGLFESHFLFLVPSLTLLAHPLYPRSFLFNFLLFMCTYSLVLQHSRFFVFVLYYIFVRENVASFSINQLSEYNYVART